MILRILNTVVITLSVVLASSTLAYGNKIDTQESSIEVGPSSLDQRHSSESSSNQDFSNQEIANQLILRQYQASYDVLDGKKSRGTMHRNLKSDGNVWQLNVSTKIKQWFFKYSFVESSTFEHAQETIKPILYTSNTERSFKDPRRIRQEFDWRNKIEMGNENKRRWEQPFADNILDHLNYQIALRQKAHSESLSALSTTPDTTKSQENINNERLPSHKFMLSYRGGFREYAFEKQKEESISTALGEISAHLYTQRVTNPKKDKYFKIWLAPDYDFVPIQFVRYKNGKKEATIRLKSFEWTQQ